MFASEMKKMLLTMCHAGISHNFMEGPDENNYEKNRSQNAQ
jgi:hypothetical protein